MPSANRITTPVSLDEDAIEGRYAPLDGYTVGFETYKQDLDAAIPSRRSSCRPRGSRELSRSASPGVARRGIPRRRCRP